MFDTLAPVGYLHIIMLIKLVIFVWAMLLAQMLWKFGVNFISNQKPAVIFVEFIEAHKYMLLL